MKDKLKSAATIAAGLAAMLLMLAIVFPALLVWALLERQKMRIELSEFDIEGKPLLNARRGGGRTRDDYASGH